MLVVAFLKKGENFMNIINNFGFEFLLAKNFYRKLEFLRD